MVQAGALSWCDALDKLVEYAELGADGEPTGRMPMLLRIADHFGIDHGVAKDVCKRSRTTIRDWFDSRLQKKSFPGFKKKLFQKYKY